jgi:hypothetical protein
MFRYVLLGYIVIYAIIAVGLFSLHALIVPPEEKKDEQSWETPLDLVLALSALAGMVLFYVRFEPAWLKLTWIPVSIALALTQAWLAFRDRQFRAAAAQDDPGAVRAAGLTTLLFLAPSLLLNFLYAFR